jgi:aminoglycoside phosphotransferase (APT) family kinase protein
MDDPGAPEHRALVERHLPDVRVESVVAVEDGWDSLVLDVNGEWIVRVPRRPQVQETLTTEIALLPELAPTLPVPIPAFEVVVRDDASMLVAYRKLHGEPFAASDVGVASAVGAFLAALHSFPVARAAELGLEARDGERWLARYEEFRAWGRSRAFPLLEAAERKAADQMFEVFFSHAAHGFQLAVVHADLGPKHVLCEGPRVTGVIDWGDVRIGDAAIDFAWLLHGLSEAFAAQLLAEYARRGGVVDPDLTGRARFYHRLGPWYELHYGLEFKQPQYVESGLAGVRARLPRQ